MGVGLWENAAHDEYGSETDQRLEGDGKGNEDPWPVRPSGRPVMPDPARRLAPKP